MNKLLIKNGYILQRDNSFSLGSLLISGGKFQDIALAPDDADWASTDIQVIDAKGNIVSPGLIDTHIHGGAGFHFVYNSGGKFQDLENRLVKTGVTAILPTSTSTGIDEMLAYVSFIKKLHQENSNNLVDVLGMHIEGPYINKEKAGAHLKEHLRTADLNEINQMLTNADGLIKVWTLAPEKAEKTTDTPDIIAHLRDSGVSVSLGHTQADYPLAYSAFFRGANRLTHTFNAMSPFSHRYKGIITAALEQNAFLELVGDGFHVSPPICRFIAETADNNSIVLISDNNEYAGAKDGNYTRASGKEMTLKDGQLKTAEGSLAGSVSDLNKCAFNMTKWGLSPGQALRMASENPARSIGLFHKKGSIAKGKDADIAIFDHKFNNLMTIKGGRIVYDGGLTDK